MPKETWTDLNGLHFVFDLLEKCITSENDYAAAFLVDNRYMQNIERFPQWMNPSINLNKELSLQDTIIEFCTRMQTKFPRKAKLRFGMTTTFTCSHCGEKVLTVNSLEETDTTVNYPGFLQMIGSDLEEEKVFYIRKGQKKAVFGELSEPLWCPSDLNAYQSLICQCGVRVGVCIKVASLRDIEILDGIWICASKTKASQSEKQMVMPKSIASSQSSKAKSQSPFTKAKKEKGKTNGKGKNKKAEETEPKPKPKSPARSQITFFAKASSLIN